MRPLISALLVLGLLGPALAMGQAQTPEDQFRAGYDQLIGRETVRDATAAAKLLLDAAKAGEPQAQYQVGVMFMDGLGLPKDHLWAFYWLSQAAGSPSLPQQAGLQAKARLGELEHKLTAEDRRRLGLAP